jgi:serine/threonine protein kinase/Tfp pilus assembly protein PilF
MIGRTISHYKIIEKIGGGGMGVVYKAQDLKLDRFVALKFLSPHLTTSEEEKQRFIHEAKTASSLQHNNICAIHEIDETEDGQIFICMDYYEGETLNKKIKEKPLPIEESIDIGIQISQGLAKAHEKEIVHRDIKPANIILTKEGVVKVLDFGLAKLSTQTKLTKESTTLGTVSYMSPEQSRGDEVDHRTDIWSLGVILYEMISGQLPFKGDYEQAVMYAITNETPEPITGLRTGVPLELERIVNRCISKDPQDRYQHADDLLSELNKLKKDTVLKTSPINLQRPKKKKFYIILPLIFISLLVLILTGYLLLKPFRVDEEELPASKWENSIAVLPFADLSPDKDQEYFCDGLTDKILTSLSKLRVLKVIARTSVMKYKNTDKTIPEIADELDVENILEGSIFKAGNRIRVTAQLINASSGAHLWADDYERKLDDVFDIQDDISEKIAANLLVNLSLQDIAEVKTNRPSSTEAYEYYMKGRYFHINKFWNSENIEDFFTSEKMFKAAIKLDPNYADSYASLADLYNSYYNGLPDTASEKGRYMHLQEAYLDTAYHIDPNSAEVNYAKGTIHYAKNEWDEAFNSFKTAIKLNQNNDHYYREIGLFLINKGCTKLSIQCYNRAIGLNPLVPHYYHERGMQYGELNEFKNAEKDFKKALEFNPNSYSIRLYWLLLTLMRRYSEADSLLAQMENIYPNMTYPYAIRYALKGQKKKALNTLKSEEWFYRVHLYTLLGMNNEAISSLYNMTEQIDKTKRSRYHLLQNLIILTICVPIPVSKKYWQNIKNCMKRI